MMVGMGIAAAIAALAASAAAGHGPSYRATLSEDQPLQVRFQVELPGSRASPTHLRLSRRSHMQLEGEPGCDKGKLVAVHPGRWAAPRPCRTVSWTVPLRDHDREGMDVAEPGGAWSARMRTWILTDRLPMLFEEGRDEPGLLRVDAWFAGGELRIVAKQLPRPDQPPFYMAVAASDPLSVRPAALQLRQFGNAPAEASASRLADVAGIWEMWRSHVVPADVRTPSVIDVIWTDAPADMEPGFYASAGSGAILMQSVPFGDAEKDRIWTEQAILLIGAHEGFHLLISGLAQTWPEWVNESWASHFAWRAARERLSGNALQSAEALVNAPASMTLLEARGNRAAGIPPRTDVLYGKGARFWADIEQVLTTRDGPAGRLGALIQDTHGLQGVDWTSADGLAGYLDERSQGRAAPIVRCYLMIEGCAASPRP